MKTRVPENVTALIACIGVSGCAKEQSAATEARLNRGCIEAISARAFTNPRVNEIAANFATRLALTRGAGSAAVPWLSKQVEFTFSDGTKHYFAVGMASSDRIALMRFVPARPPRLRIFVIDRDGNLVAAGIIENGRLLTFNVRNAEVRADFGIEQALWRLAGPDDACGLS